MFGLPKSTAVNRLLPKKAVFDKFKPSAAERKLFDEQISRLAIVAEISPQTVNIRASPDVSAVFVILITLKTPDCDPRNIRLLSKLINQRMLFALEYANSAKLAAYRAERALISKSKPCDEWALKLSGLDLGAVWENIIAQIGGINLTDGKSLDETIVANERMEKLTKQIAALEKKAMDERQPRRKWELAEELRRLKNQLEGERFNGQL